jgi:hypothetical protein
MHRWTNPLNNLKTMRALSSLVLFCAVLCGGCAAVETAPPTAMPDDGSGTLPVALPSALPVALPVEPRGIIGEPCPPALAAKAYC